MHRKYFLFVLIILFALKLSAQNTVVKKEKDTSSIGRLFLYDSKQAILGAKHSFTRPFHWKKKDFTTLGTVFASAIALSTVDDELNTYFKRQKPPKLFQEIGTRSASPQVYFIASAGIYGYGLFSKNEKIRKLGVLIISSSFTTGLIQSVSKTAFGRARPVSGYKSNEFRFWSHEPGFHSFPSGHTVLSITMSHAIAKQFDNPWYKAGIYTLGSVAPVSRLFAGAHWLTDIGLSTVLSIVVVDSIDRFLFKSDAYEYNKKEKNISWNISFTGNQIGLIGTF